MANAMTEIPPPWQSEVVIIKLFIKIFWLPLMMWLMTCLCPATSSGVALPLIIRTDGRQNSKA